MPELLFAELTYKIIGAAMEVHKTLGPGFVEAVYEAGLAYELRQLNLAFERQKALAVYYKGMVIGEYRADFVVENSVIVELKAQKALTAVDEAHSSTTSKSPRAGWSATQLRNTFFATDAPYRLTTLVIRVIRVICGSDDVPPT